MSEVKHWTVIADACAYLVKRAAEDCRNGHASAHVRAFWAVEEAKALGHLFEACEDEHVHRAVLRSRRQGLQA